MNTISLAEKAYLALKKDILTCTFEPGSQVAQSQLVERYDFGITPIREALKRLEHEGYLRSIPRFGYVISPLTMKGVEDIYEVRLMLETASVQKTVLRASDAQLQSIFKRANFTYTYKDRASYLAFLEQNIDFHVSIAQASGNRKIADMLTGVLNEMTRIFYIGLDLRDSTQEMRNEHIALVDAMLSRNVTQAVKIIEEQITSSRQRVLEKLVQSLDQRVVYPQPV